jgi:disulfide bond formation protein DsbB
MDARTFTAADTRPAAATALMVAAGSAATVVGALYFQHVLNYLPCPLCFTQRYFHYAAIPLALVVAGAALYGAPRRLIRGGFALLALVLAGGAAVGVYHAGVEWAWWPGPQDGVVRDVVAWANLTESERLSQRVAGDSSSDSGS